MSKVPGVSKRPKPLSAEELSLLAERISPGGHMPTWLEAAQLADGYYAFEVEHKALRERYDMLSDGIWLLKRSAEFAEPEDVAQAHEMHRAFTMIDSGLDPQQE